MRRQEKCIKKHISWISGYFQHFVSHYKSQSYFGDFFYLKLGKNVLLSLTIPRIWRAITVNLALALALALVSSSPSHWLRFFVHPRNKLISLHILLVTAYHFITAFPLMQPIKADIYGLHTAIMCELFPFLDLEILVKVFLYTLEISLYICIYYLYEHVTSPEPSH